MGGGDAQGAGSRQISGGKEVRRGGSRSRGEGRAKAGVSDGGRSTAPGPCTHPLLSQDGSSKSKAQGGLSKGGAPFTQGIGRPVHQICFSAPE